jgi:hypothetical protein
MSEISDTPPTIVCLPACLIACLTDLKVLLFSSFVFQRQTLTCPIPTTVTFLLLKFPSGTVCGSGCGILESYGIVLTVKRARYSLKSFHFVVVVVVVVVDFKHFIFVVVV